MCEYYLVSSGSARALGTWLDVPLKVELSYFHTVLSKRADLQSGQRDP